MKLRGVAKTSYEWRLWKVLRRTLVDWPVQVESYMWCWPRSSDMQLRAPYLDTHNKLELDLPAI